MLLLTSRFFVLAVVALWWCSCCAAPALARKEVLLPAAVAQAVPLIRCSVCEHAMFHAVRNTLDYIADGNVRHRLREERLIDHVIEPLCRPLQQGGWWLRAADWGGVAPAEAAEDGDLPSDGHGRTSKNPIGFKLRDGVNYKCGARCSTAAAACDSVVTDLADAADTMASVLIKNFQSLADAAPEDESGAVRLAQLLVSRVCRGGGKQSADGASGPSSSTSRPCSDAAASRNAQLLRKPAVRKAVAGAAPVQAMDSKEVEVEEMMFKMKHGLNAKRDDDNDAASQAGGGPGAGGSTGADVYGRDEMLRMREALRTGDREALLELDPSSADLSDEEFAALSEMHRGEFGGGGADAAAGAGGVGSDD